MIPLSEIELQAQLLERSGEIEQAQRLYRQALLDEPENADLWALLGRNCRALGQADLAVASFQQALRLRPELAAAWLDMGKTLREIGRHDEANACLKQAAQLRPDDYDPLNELGILFLQRGDLADAAAWCERALRLRPDAVEPRSNLGLALMRQGHLEEASRCFKKALSLRPDVAGLHNNLGLVLLNQGRVPEALERFEEAIRRQPDLADAHNNLGLALDEQGMPDEALASYERAALVAPNHVGALANLGNASKNQGLAEAAIASFRGAISLRPDDAALHSNLILAMMYASTLNPREILGEARRYARTHAEPVGVESGQPPARPLAGRRLRIGYVSADFQEHAVSFFLEPILASHDRARFEIFCYADVMRPDGVTERFKAYADCWRSLLGLSDAEAAELIRKDDIDILVDLHGHTAGNRLLTFARRPAPVQASYLGCLGTTGLTAIDYYLTDANADPPDGAEVYYQEQLIRLPECGFCYQAGPAPKVDPEPPFRRKRCVTFGCVNSPAKRNEEVLALWSSVLAAAPGSRLLLATGGSRRVEERIRGSLARHGLSPESLLVVGRAQTRHDYLKLYQHIDIALDPFPYNGVTTTCDALWMGVPVVSLAGVTGASRQGVRFLRSVGLDELLASTPEEYVQIASVLSGDLPRLEALHASLRERMSRSALTDSKRLTRDLEATYLAMWERRLAGQDGVTGLWPPRCPERQSPSGRS
jgi:predicted O-linked N-acetylglucosamine transferase (SPINDLY family)